jgi:phosphate-selective porin OprO/OprP
VDYFTLAGAEAIGIYGPWSLQGEYIRADVERDAGGSLGFDGYYLQASWFLTGESRNYRPDKGTVDVLQPIRNLSLKDGGWGAWELGIRFSNLDLNDGDVEGGDMDDLTLGLNWYVNQYVRFMANYVNVLSVEGGAHDGDEPDVFQIRAQVAY